MAWSCDFPYGYRISVATQKIRVIHAQEKYTKKGDNFPFRTDFYRPGKP